MISKITAAEDLPKFGVVLSDRQLKRLEDAGQFPKRVRLTSRSHGYVTAEIVAYQDQKIAARDGVAA